MKLQTFFEEFERQAHLIGLSSLLSGFSLYLDTKIDYIRQLEKEQAYIKNKEFWDDIKEKLCTLESQVDGCLDAVTSMKDTKE